MGGGGTVFPKGIRSAGPKIGPDRIPYDTGSQKLRYNFWETIFYGSYVQVPNTGSV